MRDHIDYQTQALMYNLANDKYNWYYHTVPQPNVKNREFYWPRGRVFGGSSSLNAMVYVRGNGHDQNRWAKEVGDEKWDYDHVLPYFKRAQKHQCGGDTYRKWYSLLKFTRAYTVKCYPFRKTSGIWIKTTTVKLC